MDDDFIPEAFTVAGFIQTTHHIAKNRSVDVWKAFNMLTASQLALKTKSIPASTGTPPADLVHEASIYQLLRPGAHEGFPSIHWSGVDGNQFVLAMDLLGPNLQSLKYVCRGTLSLRTICMLAEQMISRLQYIHSRGIISGDVKPHNFAMGIGSKARIVHMFDFGHATFFVDPATNEHIPFRRGRPSIGTIRYLSVAGHLGHEISRRDDLESLLYSLVELYHGTLPWAAETELLRIARKKAGKEFQDFLATCLPEFQAFHAHCGTLSFGQAPDYALLKDLFRGRMDREGWQYDWKFDWEDCSALEQGTLVPEEYVFDLRFVQRRGLDPQ